MINYDMKEIRNIAFLGHKSSGKTSLIESMLVTSGTIPKKNNIDFTINTSVNPIEFKGHKYNILDTPGYFDFLSESHAAVRVSGGGVLVIDAETGIEVGTEKSWEILEESKKPYFIFLNKMDRDIKDYNKILESLKEKFGKKVAPFCIPIIEDEKFKGFVNVVDMIGRIYNGKECINAPIPDYINVTDVRNMLLEAVAEIDDTYMDKFFAGEEFTTDEIRDGLHKGVVAGNIVPVIVGSAQNNIGIQTLFTMLYNYMPTPSEMKDGKREGLSLDLESIEIRQVSENEAFSALVFKTYVDPFLGKISLFKVNSGTIKKDTEILNSSKNKKERISHLFFMRNNTQIPTDEIRAGDIGATSKLVYTQTGDTLCSKDRPIIYEKTFILSPAIYYSITPKDKNDDEKLSTSLQKITEEDPSVVLERSKETKELLLGCQGDKHLEVALNKLESKFGVHALVSEPTVAYKETIRKAVTVQGKHKKQSGGAGQYGDVFIKFEPSTEVFEFHDEIHGGVVPKQYIPAVEKGIIEAMEKGSLAGFPVINIKATLNDGSYHAVDSNEISFKLAAILAFRKAMEIANPVLLEPIMKITIEVPEEYIGDIMGDLNKRRGKIIRMEQNKPGKQLIIADVPHNEILKYALDLKSMTQGRGISNFEFSHYQELQGPLADKIIASQKNNK